MPYLVVVQEREAQEVRGGDKRRAPMSYVSEGREYGTVKSFHQKRALIATDECGDTDPRCSKYGRNTQRGPDSGASDGMRVHTVV